MATKDALKARLTALLARMGNGYGQDAGGDGQLQETSAATIAEAVPSCIGPEHTMIETRLLDRFETLGEDVDGHAEFMQLVKDWGLEFGNVLYAAVGVPECFYPDNPNDKGGWHFCFLFLRANCEDKNLLVTFRTSET